MNKEELQQEQELLPDRPPSYYRQFREWTRPKECPTAREAYKLLGKELPTDVSNNR